MMHLRQSPLPRGEALVRLKSNLVAFLILLAAWSTAAYSQLLQWLASLPNSGYIWHSLLFWTSLLALAYFALNAVTAAYFVKYAETPIATVSRPAFGTPAAGAARRAVLSKSSPLTRAHPPSPSVPLFPTMAPSPLKQSTSHQTQSSELATSTATPSLPSPSIRQMLQQSTNGSPVAAQGGRQSDRGSGSLLALSGAGTPTKSRGDVGEAAVLAYRGRHDPESLGRSTSSRA